ncbi:hypothetical protein INT44_004052 [Umbelopsis vinacea]|uniref:Small ribosomal subunit protein mS38 n=1 Tax=Umbelopsis vinacea TaxID=44442 RepID=A0A8H7QA95_9FUNG|nr:hypothetical protein INT44_004052 [Umbelopsis vinacea]
MLTSRLSRPLSVAFRTRPSFLKAVSTTVRPYSSEHNDGSNPDSNKTETKRQAPAVRLPFVPVINIPEQELAHTAFFALHRPLLGLANEDVPYFGHQSYPPGENDVEDVEDLSRFMTNMRPFGSPETSVEDDDTTFTVTLNPSNPSPFSAANDLVTPTHQLETHVMPGADQIVDYLNMVQEKMKKEDEAMHATSVLRKRKLKMNKHKHKKLMKRTRALRKRIGK